MECKIRRYLLAIEFCTEVLSETEVLARPICGYIFIIITPLSNGRYFVTISRMARTVKKSSVKKATNPVSNLLLNRIAPLKKISVNWQTWRRDRRFYLVLIIIGLLLVFAFKKSWLVAATVNNEPISNLELQTKLNQQFRDQLIAQLVNEKLLDQEARKNQVTVTQEDLNQKITELENNVGGAEALDSLLSQQGQTRVMLKDQLRIQVIIEKLYSKEATLSAEEVADYVIQNQAQFKASDSAGQKKEAEDLLKQQKLGQIFSEKFQALKNLANVKIF